MKIRSLFSILIILCALAVAAPAVAQDQPAGDRSPAVSTLEAPASAPLFFEVPSELSTKVFNCTPNPCADCYAEYQCCLQYFCASGDFACRLECNRRYRNCSFTCP